MAQEIERKFLVQTDAWRSGVRASKAILQGYMMRGPDVSLRIRVFGSEAFLTIKSTNAGIMRSEYEYEIPLPDAMELLQTACNGPLIEKTRHEIDYARQSWVVDEFKGSLSGLALAEIELASEDQAIDIPPWAGREVTDDPAYRNSNLGQPPVVA